MFRKYSEKIGLESQPEPDEPISEPEKWCRFLSLDGHYIHGNEMHLELSKTARKLGYTIHFFELSREFYPPQPPTWEPRSIEQLHEERLNFMLNKLATSQVIQAKAKQSKLLEKEIDTLE